jgi:hypothetical protein
MEDMVEIPYLEVNFCTFYILKGADDFVSINSVQPDAWVPADPYNFITEHWITVGLSDSVRYGHFRWMNQFMIRIPVSIKYDISTD